MIVVVLRDAEVEVVGIRDVDSFVVAEKSIVGLRPTWIGSVADMFECFRIGGEVGYDVGVKLFGIHDDTGSEGRDDQR